jgi:membrane-associated phospholipid phosphatase
VKAVSVTPSHAGVWLRQPRGVLVVTAACFAALALAAALVGALPADVAVRDALLAAASKPVITVMKLVNMAGDYRLLVPGTIALYLVFPRARRRWLVWLALMLAATIGPDIAKFAVGRTRPEELSLGFPSGHATAAAAYFGAVIYLAAALTPPLRTVARAGAVALIVGVGIARVVLRAHWPSDVLGGIALGLALAAAAALVDAIEPE